MIGMVLVMHGGLAVEFRRALEHVISPQDQLDTITIGHDDDVDQRRADIIAAVKHVDTGEGVVVLTDLFGATPSNCAISVMADAGVEIIAGINLPLLIKLAAVRADCSLPEAICKATEAGRKYIMVAGQVLAGQKRARARDHQSAYFASPT